jgi:hypothetical protein
MISTSSSLPPDSEQELDRTRAAKPAALTVFTNIATVTGIGIIRMGDRYGLKVNLHALPPDAQWPAEIEGVPITVEVVGTVRKRS